VRARAYLGLVIEFFEDEPGFLAAWEAEAPPDATLLRALRADVRPRYASVTDAPDGGVLLLAPAGPDWEPYLTRQGFIGARQDGDVVLIHWSSPLMYQRAVQAVGELLPGGALYARAPISPTGPTARG
jgi:hypothetical protein